MVTMRSGGSKATKRSHGIRCSPETKVKVKVEIKIQVKVRTNSEMIKLPGKLQVREHHHSGRHVALGDHLG